MELRRAFILRAVAVGLKASDNQATLRDYLELAASALLGAHDDADAAAAVVQFIDAARHGEDPAAAAKHFLKWLTRWADLGGQVEAIASVLSEPLPAAHAAWLERRDING